MNSRGVSFVCEKQKKTHSQANLLGPQRMSSSGKGRTTVGLQVYKCPNMKKTGLVIALGGQSHVCKSNRTQNLTCVGDAHPSVQSFKFQVKITEGACTHKANTLE